MAVQKNSLSASFATISKETNNTLFTSPPGEREPKSTLSGERGAEENLQEQDKRIGKTQTGRGHEPQEEKKTLSVRESATKNCYPLIVTVPF